MDEAVAVASAIEVVVVAEAVSVVAGVAEALEIVAGVADAVEAPTVAASATLAAERPPFKTTTWDEGRLDVARSCRAFPGVFAESCPPCSTKVSRERSRTTITSSLQMVGGLKTLAAACRR